MMSVETIISLTRASAVRAAAYELEPYQPASREEIIAWRTFPFPDLGSYRPAEWTLVDRVLADATGLGEDWEPALTVKQLKLWCLEKFQNDPTAGFAVIETGQFQVVVGYFSQDPEAEPKEGDYGESTFEWVYCPKCSEPVARDKESCPWCYADFGGDDTCNEKNKAWEEGVEAYETGKGQSENPYEGGTEEYLDWDEGWRSAKRREARQMADDGQPNFLGV